MHFKSEARHELHECPRENHFSEADPVLADLQLKFALWWEGVHKARGLPKGQFIPYSRWSRAEMADGLLNDRFNGAMFNPLVKGCQPGAMLGRQIGKVLISNLV
jgi:hypothetical protein